MPEKEEEPPHDEEMEKLLAEVDNGRVLTEEERKRVGAYLFKRIDKIREESKTNGLDEMSDEEIDAIVKNVREELFGENKTTRFEHSRETSYPCKKSDGYGMIIEIRSADEHGETGNQQTPARAHIYDANKVPVGEIVITPNKPASPNEVISYRRKLPDSYTRKICEWANDSNKHGVNHWDYLIDAWERRRPD